MSELEKVKRAKTYMDQLARGIDPISNQPIIQEMSNERLMKCFLFVSALLDQIIENGGEVKNASNTYRTEININSILTKEAVSISTLTKKIEDVSGRSIPAVKITAWLLKEGYLTDKTIEGGKKSRETTAKGNQLGISMKSKVKTTGESYHMNFYDQKAQKFILTHLQDIESYKPESYKHKKSNDYQKRSAR